MAFGVTGFFCPVVPDAFLYYAIAIKSFFGICTIFLAIHTEVWYNKNVFF